MKKGPNKPFWVTEKFHIVTMAMLTPAGTDQHSLKGVVDADNGYMPLHINYNAIKLMLFNWPNGLPPNLETVKNALTCHEGRLVW